MLPALDTDSTQLPLIPLQETFHGSSDIFAVFPSVVWFIFLLLLLSTALQGQDFSSLSGYNFSEFTPFSSPLSKSSPGDLSRKNKLPDCIVIREIIHIKHSPCEHEHYNSSFKQSRHSAVTGRGITYLLQNWPS